MDGFVADLPDPVNIFLFFPVSHMVRQVILILQPAAA